MLSLPAPVSILTWLDAPRPMPMPSHGQDDQGGDQQGEPAAVGHLEQVGGEINQIEGQKDDDRWQATDQGLFPVPAAHEKKQDGGDAHGADKAVIESPVPLFGLVPGQVFGCGQGLLGQPVIGAVQRGQKLAEIVEHTGGKGVVRGHGTSP